MHPRVILVSVIACGTLFLFPNITHAASLYWVGANGANTSVASNWSTVDPVACGIGDAGAAPGSIDIAIFDADCDNNATIDSTFTVLGINLTTGYTGTVSAGAGVSVTVGASGFIQSAGTFTSTSGTMTVSGNWTHTAGGTFTHNSGTVTFDGGPLTTIDVATTETFNNLTFNAGDGITKTISSGDTLVAVGTLTLTDGSIGTGTVEAQAGMTHGALFDGGNGTVTLTTTATRTVNLTAGGSLPSFTINATNATVNGNSSGTTTIAGTLTMQAGTYTGGNGITNVTGNLSVSGGALTTSGSSGAMTVTGTATVSGGTLTPGGTLTVNLAFSQSGGTVASSSATIDMNYTFTLSTGTFTSTSGTLSVADAFTHTTGGTFTHNSGTVTFDGGSLTTIDVATTETFNNLTFNAGDGITRIISSGDTLVAVGTLTLTDGIVDTGTLEAQASVMATSLFDGGSAPLKFTQGATQTFTLTGATGVFNADMSVNKSGGQVNLASALVMDADNQDMTIIEGTFDVNANNLTVSGIGSTFIVEDGGNLQLQGGETVTTPTLNTGSTVTYDGTSSYTVKNWTYHHMTFNGSGGVFSLGAVESTAGNLTITAGTFDIAGNNMTVTGTFSNSDTFRLQGGETTVSLTMDTDSGTVVYNGTSSYTGLKAGNSYYNLTFNGTGGTWTMNATLDVNSDLTITAGTLATGNNNITLAGSWSNSGAFTEGTGTVTFDGTGAQTLNGETFYNLTINNSAGSPSDSVDIDSSAAVTVTNTLTVTDGQFQPTTASDFTAVTISTNGILKPDSGATITVSTTWANTGTFTANTGTVTFDGTNQTISGTTTFYNVTKAVTSTYTLTFTAASTQTIANTLTLNGAAGNKLYLRSSTSGNIWSINPQGTRTINYLDVQDSTNTNATAIDASSANTTDSGNNTNWTFAGGGSTSSSSSSSSSGSEETTTSSTKSTSSKKTTTTTAATPKQTTSETIASSGAALIAAPRDSASLGQQSDTRVAMLDETKNSKSVENANSDDSSTSDNLVVNTTRLLNGFLGHLGLREKNPPPPTVAGAAVASVLGKYLQLPPEEVVTYVREEGAAIAVTAVTAGAAATLPSIFLNLTPPLAQALQILGASLAIRKKKIHWGSVIDSTLGRPMRNIAVQVFQATSHQLKETQITGADGQFGFLLPPGTYYLLPHGEDAVFPATKKPPITLADGEALYTGEEFVIDDPEKIPRLRIVMDRQEDTLVPHALIRRYIQKSLMYIDGIGLTFLIFGSAINTLLLLMVPGRLNFGVEALYAVLLSIKLYILLSSQRGIGSVVDKNTGALLDLVIVRLYNTASNRIIQTRVTNAKGKFLLLVPKGTYTVSFSKPGYDNYVLHDVRVSGKTSKALSLNVALVPLDAPKEWPF